MKNLADTRRKFYWKCTCRFCIRLLKYLTEGFFFYPFLTPFENNLSGKKLLSNEVKRANQNNSRKKLHSKYLTLWFVQLTNKYKKNHHTEERGGGRWSIFQNDRKTIHFFSLWKFTPPLPSTVDLGKSKAELSNEHGSKVVTFQVILVNFSQMSIL